eukprot:TRINITY_DN114_c0_g2_i1.p1 TRINITY_DN114_c0_g2~~TRINITY_DN114_c0_g2_i1.p1  ORF type:complete len:222 (-),score=3.49 TRINITY_DN114_c0_g2_i1:189-854(-)
MPSGLYQDSTWTYGTTPSSDTFSGTVLDSGCCLPPSSTPSHTPTPSPTDTVSASRTATPTPSRTPTRTPSLCALITDSRPPSIPSGTATFGSSPTRGFSIIELRRSVSVRSQCTTDKHGVSGCGWDMWGSKELDIISCRSERLTADFTVSDNEYTFYCVLAGSGFNDHPISEPFLYVSQRGICSVEVRRPRPGTVSLLRLRARRVQDPEGVWSNVTTTTTL